MKRDIHVHVHIHHDGLEHLINRRFDKVESLMAEQDAKFEVAFGKLNTATSRVAAVLRSIADQLKAGGLTKEQEDAQVVKIEAAAAALDAMAQDAENPVPNPGDGGTPV